MQLHQKVIGGPGIGDEPGNPLQAMGEILPFLPDVGQRAVGVNLVLKTFHGGDLRQSIDRPGLFDPGEFLDHPGVGNQVSGPEPGQGVEFSEGTEKDEAGG